MLSRIVEVTLELIGFALLWLATMAVLIYLDEWIRRKHEEPLPPPNWAIYSNNYELSRKAEEELRRHLEYDRDRSA